MSMKRPKTARLFEKLESNEGYEILPFPDDIDVNGSQNIMFININVVSGSQYKEGGRYKTIEGENTLQRGPNTSSLSRKFGGSSERIAKTIALYVPNNVQTAYGADWSTTDLGLAGAAVDAGTGLGELGELETWQQVWNAAKITAPNAAMNTAAGVTQTLTGFNAQDAKKLGTRTITNPYTEVIFNGVTNRTFSFTFKFIPKSRKEQEQIKKIIDTLKFHRAPEIKYKQQVNNYWLFPSTFDIMFFNKNKENDYLFKISTCAMTNMNVEFGGESHFATHDDGAPFYTTLTLEFTELEVLTKERHEQGF